MTQDIGQPILVVEDEPGVRHFVQAVLTRNGYAPLAAGSAAEALRLVGEHEGDIGMVISDVFLPDMNGRALVEHLRERQPSLPVVFISGFAREDFEGLALPATGFVEKPFRAQDLLEVMQVTRSARA